MIARRIACVYCGDAHDTAAEVRACWVAHAGVEAAVDTAEAVAVAAEIAAGIDNGTSALVAPHDVAHGWETSSGPISATVGADEPIGVLAPDQQAAVFEPSHTVRIIAPAGSGKTRVLTERARHLVRDRGIRPGEIALIAFNKRAQEEMAARTADLPGLQVRTLNALALAIVNGSRGFAPRSDTRRTIDEPEVRRILQRLVTFPKKRNADPVAPWIEALSAARLGMTDPAVIERRYDGEVEGFVAVLPAYRAELARQGIADFDEQIILAVDALQGEPATLAAAQRVCRYLLVDEFQDLTPAHLLLVRLIAGDAANVFAVGDDDQTIYGYNGADPAWLIDFSDHFPGAVAHALTVNYRCPADIVASADRLLRHNRRRVAKTIFARPDAGDGLVVNRDVDSVAATLSAVRAALADGTQRPVDVAVLTRVNSLLAPVQAALVVAGIPVTGGVGREFVDRTSVRAALAWLRLASNDTWTSADLGEALRRPSRSLHPRITDWVTEQTSMAGLLRLADRVTSDRDSDTIRAFVADIQQVRRLVERTPSTTAVLELVRDGLGLGRSVAGLDKQRHGMNRAAQGDDLTALVHLGRLHDNPVTFERWLADVLGRPWSRGGVTLATVHRVKGQEWPTVIVHHAADDQYPHRLAEDLEEERRVFHVAVTRASRRLVVTTGDSPSGFVDELFNEPRVVTSSAVTTRDDLRTVNNASRLERSMAASRPGHDLAGDHLALFERLKDLRRHLANGKPAYVVFGDAVLDAMVRVRPATMADLGTIKGVGPAKLTQYGQQFLDALNEGR